MFKKSFSIFVLALVLGPGGVFAQEPYSTQPSYNPVPGEFGAGQQNLTVPLPPQVPPYLPNGAINLDYVWTQDGGARLYWNNVIIPRELKMDGSYWIDPALVPQLIPEKTTPARRVWRRTARAKTHKVAKVKVPAKVASTALKAPAIPLPVTETTPVAPLKATQAPVASKTETDEPVPPITPPRLQ